MIRIITENGVALDLDPSAEFEIEYENPMLDDSHIPVPFSTSVALPATAANSRELGYFPAMMLEPALKSIAAAIEVGGIPLMRGTLVYDTIENGCLNYTFTGRDVEVEWGKKIWQLNIRKFKGSEWGDVVNDVLDGNEEDVYAPLMENPSAVAKSVYKDSEGKVELLAVAEKYMNCPVLVTGGQVSYKLFSYDTFVPVIGVDRILSAAGGTWSELPEFSPLAVVGRYPSAAQYYRRMWQQLGSMSVEDVTKFNDTEFDLAETLPDVSVVELVKNLSGMLCAAVYYDGEYMRFVSFDEVIAAAPADWSGKISDDYSSSGEENCRYAFGFSDDSSGSGSSTSSKSLSDDGITRVVGMSGVLAGTPKDDYKPMLNGFTGDVYSGKFFMSGGNRVYLEDMVLHNAEVRESDVSGDDVSSFDAISDFTPVRTVPVVLYVGTPSTSYSPIYRVAPLVEPMSADAERDSKLYVGYVYDGQMTDSGYTLGSDGKERLKGAPLTKLAYQYPEHLMSVNSLWNSHHVAFAEWLSRDRQCVSADVNLSLFDICNFRMYRMVYFGGRRWLVKKLTLTFSAVSDKVSARGEFISFDPWN